jgi:hypothetical protein
MSTPRRQQGTRPRFWISTWLTRSRSRPTLPLPIYGEKKTRLLGLRLTPRPESSTRIAITSLRVSVLRTPSTPNSNSHWFRDLLRLQHEPDPELYSRIPLSVCGDADRGRTEPPDSGTVQFVYESLCPFLACHRKSLRYRRSQQAGSVRDRV